jgi:CheY-like chemotaxis protein
MNRLGHCDLVTDRAHSPATETVLVVEDEVFIRMVIAEYLRSCGYKVIEAANADEALLVLEHVEIRVDVVFSDIEMPGSMDGFALSTWVHANRPELDVILTGSVPRSANAAAELCDSGPLPKPYEPQIVVDRIRRLIGARARPR